MSNVVRFRKTAFSGPKGSKSDKLNSRAPSSRHKISTDLMYVAKAHGFMAYAVLDISERKGDIVFPKLTFHGLGIELGNHISSIEDLSNCSVFLMLSTTNIPFPFTTGLDCRTHATPDPDLLDNQLDGLLNMYGIRGGYCVPVCSPDAQRSVVMYFGVREEHYSRYPNLILDTVESFDAIWHEQKAKFSMNSFSLSNLEIECYKGLASGKSLTAISRELSLSEHTISICLQSGIRKTEASSYCQALAVLKLSGII